MLGSSNFIPLLWVALFFSSKNAEGQTAVALKYIEFDNIAEAVAGILGHIENCKVQMCFTK